MFSGNRDIFRGSYSKDDDGSLPFRYKHLGGFEYVGYDEAITKRGTQAMSIIDGPVGIYYFILCGFVKVLIVIYQNKYSKKK